MDIQITEAATDWYKHEYELKEGAIRLFVRYGGIGGHIPGFSLGVIIEQPSNPLTSTEMNNMLFYVEESDAWYFDDKDLIITLDEEKNEPRFTFQ